MSEQRLIDQFNKNSVEIIKVCVQPWKDELYFDIRIWHLEDPGRNGAELPAKKGLRLNVEHLPRLIQAFQETQRSLKEGEMPEKMHDTHQERRSPEGKNRT